MKYYEYCPADDLGCPYCTKDGHCTIKNPQEECDEYMVFYNNEEV